MDSISRKGIDELKTLIVETLKNQEMRDVRGAFRLPIDQVFSVKGQGTVVRGTVYEGHVSEGQTLTVMPKGLTVKARQIQVHHHHEAEAFAGQRAAINLAGVTKEELERGDVLVSSEHFIVTKTVDVAIHVVSDLDYIVRQRMPIKCHIGTAEVMGKIVFFDRNEIEDENNEVLCQLRLEEEVVAKRGDRFILRRPSPIETIGGGWVIEPRGEKYKFGYRTIQQLEKKKVGTPAERITAALVEGKSLTLMELVTITALEKEMIVDELTKDEFVQYNKTQYTIRSLVETLHEDFMDRISSYHTHNSMKLGINKAKLFHQLEKDFPKVLLEFVLQQSLENRYLKKRDQFIALASFDPHVPESWQKRTDNMLAKLKSDEFNVVYFEEYLKTEGIPERLHNEIKHFLEVQQQIISLDANHYWHGDIFQKALRDLRSTTGTEFTLKEAKETLGGLSRKLLVPFLEKLDQLGLTRRVENNRVWNERKDTDSSI